MVLSGEGWHRGVVGITAARVSERFGVPAVVIGYQDGHGHGSGRAPDGFPLFDAIARCAQHLERFGGHQAASGLSLRADRLEGFREQFNVESVALQRAAAGPPPTKVDVTVGAGGYALPPASDLARLEPLGEGNTEPVFLITEARVESTKVVGNGHLKLALRTGEQRMAAFGLDMAARAPERGRSINAVGLLRPDTWAGGEQVELRLLDFD